MQHTHLQKRNGVYYYRQKVPADLLDHYARRQGPQYGSAAVDEFADAVHPGRSGRTREFV